MRITASQIACFLAVFMMSSLSLESAESDGGNRRSSPAPPYPASPVIGQVVFDWSSHEKRAPGSDNWPVTWADDGNQYTAWGDGVGFSGTNADGRVKLGVARIEGDADSYVGKNVWGGKDPENPHQFEGKNYGMLCIEGVLTMWVAHQPNPHQHACQLAWSKDHGATWRLVDWTFTYEDDITIPTFLNFGRNYQGARDEYVYSYCIQPTWGKGKLKRGRHGFDVQRPGHINLLRVPRQHLLERSHFECLCAFAADGKPVWSADLSAKVPVFADPNGVGWNVSAIYDQPLGRYLLCTEHTETSSGHLGIFDAPEPWGPWTTVAYETAWGKGHLLVCVLLDSRVDGFHKFGVVLEPGRIHRPGVLVVRIES